MIVQNNGISAIIFYYFWVWLSILGGYFLLLKGARKLPEFIACGYSLFHIMIIGFCSLGNHEYYTGDVDNWIKFIPQFNVTPLMNKRVCLYRSRDLGTESCDRGLYLAGLEDIETRKMR